MSHLTSTKLDVFKTLWQGKWMIMGITSLFAVLSVVWSLSLPNVYRSDALLAPMTGESSGQGLASLANQFGGLASMAGISLGGSQTDKATLALESLRSRSFLMDFIEKYDLKVQLMAAKDWDSVSNTLVLNEQLYDESSQTWVREVTPPKQPEPSAWEAFEVFSQIMTLERNKENGLVSLSIEHYSPYIASQWMEWLVAEINQYMREKDLREAHQSIAYLQKQAVETDVVGMQAVLYQLIEEQMKTVMLAEVRDEYAFEYVDPPMVPEMKYKPSRAIICIVGTFFGGLLGCVLVVLLAVRKMGLQQASPSHSVNG